MTINTVFEQVKNCIAPEVKAEQSVSLSDSGKHRFDLMQKLAVSFGLQLLEDNGVRYRFKFPGSPIVALSQVKVVWGARPDEAPYRKLQAFVQIDWLEEQKIQIKLYENLFGTQAEQEVYRRVLSQRLEKIVDCLHPEYSLEKKG